MQEPPADPLTAAFLLALVVASILAWAHLFSLWWRRGCLLKYEPRRQVPWGPVAGSLAVIFVLIALLTAATAGPPTPPPVVPDPLTAADRLFGLMVIQLMTTGAALALVFVFSTPTLQDLGLPAYVDGLTRDVATGIVASLAAIAPVYGLLVAMRHLQGDFHDPSHHPLVEMVTNVPHFGVVLLASIAAVVVAPICEEIVFRLLLQGWLEKWEDGRCGRLVERPNDEAQMTNDDEQMTNDEQMANDECRMTKDRPSPREDSSLVIRHSSLLVDQPLSRGVAGLPYGWAPILISSVLFALAHFGYGPEPVPLFVLALILGYVYQRTHRIVPCIVTHALFNLIAVVALWRLVSLSPE